MAKREVLDDHSAERHAHDVGRVDSGVVGDGFEVLGHVSDAVDKRR